MRSDLVAKEVGDELLSGSYIADGQIMPVSSGLEQTTMPTN